MRQLHDAPEIDDFSLFDFLSTSYLQHMILFNCVHISIYPTSDALSKKSTTTNSIPFPPSPPSQNIHQLRIQTTAQKKRKKKFLYQIFVPHHIRHPLIQPKNITFQ